MPKRYLTARDYVLEDNALLRLGFVDTDARSDTLSRIQSGSGSPDGEKVMASTFGPEDRVEFDLDRAVGMLRDDPGLGARLLGLSGGMEGNGDVYWAGAHAARDTSAGSFGVRVLQRREGDEVVGDNRFGEFLTEVRDAYREYLRSNVFDQVHAPDPSMVVTDFTRPGSYESDIEVRERAGEEFIHTDVYRPKGRRFDTALDGTTGHAGRAAAPEVSFQRFDCPFGTGWPSPLVVDTAAEASMLYERAIRGDLDWKALIRSFDERGALNRNLTERQKENMARDYDSQFRWMRERIATDSSLRDLQVVGASHLVADDSLGRSVYDAAVAPSPADVLRYYIENPVMLFAQSKSYVVSALQEGEKNEPQRLVVDPSKAGDVTVLVIGSDTIGGREPGGKGYSDLVKEVKYSDGQRVVTSRKAYKVPMKAEAEVERDYQAFRTRMDEVLSGVPEGVNVRLVSGSSSTMGASVGVGTPRMVERYVREKGGEVAGWDFTHHRAEPLQKDAGKPRAEDSSLSAVLLEHFAELSPVLVGRSPEVRFLLDQNDAGSEVTFSQKDGLRAGAAVCLSAEGDTNNRNVLALGSYAMEAGLPVVHVREVRSEQEQLESLRSASLLSLSAITGEVAVGGEALWGEGIERREEWDIAASNNLSYVDSENNVAVPLVSELFPAGVSVAGHSYSSAYSVYAALLAQELGRTDADTLSSIYEAEGYVGRMGEAVSRLTGGEDVPGDVQERCLRRSVRLMAEANEGFADRLLALDGRDVVMPVASGDMTLFTDMDGKGLNRFGMVLAVEGARMRELREARRQQEEQERMKVLEEASRKQRVVDGRSAEGQKVKGGLPAGPEGAEGAVWFIGTHTPDQLALTDGKVSFDMWDDMGGQDRLVRAKAVAQRVDDGEGGKVENNCVFLFPSDLAAVTGRYRTSPRPDSTNLTGCMRVDPKTGEKFPCAFGIPVRFNNRGYELFNKEGMPCSYRLDNDAANYARSLVLADSQARVQAIRHDMTLYLPGRVRSNGEDYYSLGQVFMDKAWNKKDGWTDNPHRAPLNLDITERYISLLERGRDYPLTLVPLPMVYYRPDDPEGARERAEKEGKHYVSAEGRFLADLNLSLRIANATALALGVPMRFPLDKDGRIDLGPGVPEEFRKVAEQKIDAFIGADKGRSVLDGKLRVLEVLDTAEALDVRSSASGQMKKAGDVYLRPNDLVPAFGEFDFDALMKGLAPLHEMMFRLDGDYFYLTDSQSNKGRSVAEINKYLSYEKNDERRFVIRTNAPERVDEFKDVLLEYVTRAKAVSVEMRLVQEREAEAKDLPMDGFVNLLDSNSEDFARSEHDIGRTATVYNAVGRVNREGAVEDRNVSGEKNGGVYYGRTDAKDGFAGYAQIRYSYDGAPMSPWTTVRNLGLAKDIVMSMVGRKYASMDERVVPSAKVLDMMATAEAMKHLVLEGTVLAKGPSGRTVREADSKVVELQRPETAPAEKGASRLGTGAETPEEYWFVALSAEDARRAFSYFYREDAPVGAFSREELEMMRDAVEKSRKDGDLKAVYAVYDGFTDGQKKVMLDEVSASLEFYPSDGLVDQAKAGPIEYSVSSGGYQQRTAENANAPDVTFTFAFAVDFSTYGERATAKAAGDSIVQTDIPVLPEGGVDLSRKAVETAARGIAESLPDEYLKGEPCGLNIAGNGIYTLGSKGVTQDQADEFVTRVLDSLRQKGMDIQSIRSGGQTGIDEAGAVAGVVLGIPTTVHTTKDWAFRGTDNKDVRKDEAAFKARFARKDYASLSAKVGQAQAPKRKEKLGRRPGQTL